VEVAEGSIALQTAGISSVRIVLLELEDVLVCPGCWFLLAFLAEVPLEDPPGPRVPRGEDDPGMEHAEWVRVLVSLFRIFGLLNLVPSSITPTSPLVGESLGG